MDVKIGEKFNYLTVIGEPFRDLTLKSKTWKVLCRCDCGNEKNININSLVRGDIKSCGCYRKQVSSEQIRNHNLKDTKNVKNGDKFNRLTILEEPFLENGKSRVKCQCECGDIKIYQLSAVKNGNTKSCGCLVRELSSLRARERNTKHGLTNHPLYMKWNKMKEDRNANVCDEWLNDFQPFYDWATNNRWKDGMFLARLIFNKDYSPTNCVFVERQPQYKDNKLVDYKDFVGQKYHSLTILDQPFKSGKYYYVRCLCDCGNKITVSFKSLKMGHTKSCGCKSGLSSKKYSKERTLHRLYKLWINLKNKCYNKNSSGYLDGIQMFNEWRRDYNKFFEWCIQNGSESYRYLNRINEELDFSPDNCCFEDHYHIPGKHIERAKQKRIATCNEKYWCDYSVQSPEVIQKKEQTCLERYGTKNPSSTQEVRERVKNTSRTKYGVDTPTQSQEVKDKIKKTNLEKYGVECTLKDPATLEKIRQSNLKNLGVDNPFASPEVQSKIRQTNLKKYGYEIPTQNPEIAAKGNKTKKEKYGEWYYVNHKTQQAIFYWFYNLGVSFDPDVPMLDGKEIDLYNDELKLGIEFCGLYWHNESTQPKRGKKYHYNKYKLAEEKGIRLITIFSDEWQFRRQQVEGFLRSVVKKNDNIIHARKCITKAVSPKIGKEFINNHHIQPQKRCGLHYIGLYHNQELVGILSLKKHHRTNKPSEVVIDRIAFKYNTYVIGGMQKITKHTVDWCKKNNYTKIITWSDNRWSDGKVYEKCGFELEAKLPPDYSYVESPNYKTRISKQAMKKSRTGCSIKTTEREWCKENGYHRIWDCGKKRFVLTL